ncbi:MAG: putative permease [Candidatus Midichloriaceae bacterium]|jgi:predicted permease
MSFLGLISKILPLYIIVIQGYIGGKLHDIDTKSISKLMFHFIMPIIFFDVALNLKMEVKYMILPILFFFFSTILSVISKKIAGKYFSDGRENVIGYAAGSMNVNSLGLSIAMLVMDDDYIRMFMLATISSVLYTNTVGRYIISNHVTSGKGRFMFLFKTPPFYAFIIGLVANISEFELFDGFNNLFSQMRATYVVLGMLIFGLSLSRVKLNAGVKFMTYFSMTKILLSPLLYVAFILLDKFLFHIYDNEMYKVFLLLAALPPGADCIMTAILFDKHAEKASVGVLISTIISTLYIPLILLIFEYAKNT